MSYFLGGFLGLAFGVALLLGAGLGAPPSEAFGRPRVPPSRIASKSATQYIPADPIYLWGLLSCLLSRLLIATPDTLPPRRSTIIGMVNSSFSIYISIPISPPVYQAKNAKKFIHIDNYNKNVNKTVYFDKISKNVIMPKHFSDLLYNCIAKRKKICKFLRQTLDDALMRGYLYSINA
jgi:hypothetical protein